VSWARAWRIISRRGALATWSCWSAGRVRAKGARGARPGDSAFGTRVNVELSLLSREKLLRFKEETNVDPGFRQCGYIFVACDEDELAALVSAQAVQRECGLIEARTVNAKDIARLNPAVNVEGVTGGVYCPTDGFIRPLELLRGYEEAAARMGVRFERGVEVEGFRKDARGTLESVQTSRGEFSARAFVNAAGAWAGEVGRMAGVSVPVTPLRRQVAITGACELLPEEMPMTIFVGDGFHLRVRDGRVLLLWPDEPRTKDAFDTCVEDEWVNEVVRRARERVLCLKDTEVERGSCWAGLYEMSPDRHALLGRAAGLENFYLANGSSGHGVMHSPALGQLLAEIILDGHAHTLDVHTLRPSRFNEGEPNAGLSLL
jgi:sarcosine oxidase subunit beta